MRRRALLLVTVSVAAVLAGTATGAKPFHRHVVGGQGVSVATPPSWIAVDRRAVLSGDIVEKLSRQNPRLAPFIRPLAQPSSPLEFIAFDPAVRGGFATNVNVVVVPLAGAPTFAAYRQALLAELRVLVPSGKVEQSVVTVHGAQALRVRYRFRLTVGTPFTVQALQYAFPRNGRSVVVTYTTLPRQASGYAATFRSSAASIRFSR
jgi:hypothetical protein